MGGVIRYFTMKDLKERYKLRSSTTIWDWVKKGLLPQPYHLRQRALWSDVQVAAADRKLITPPNHAADRGTEE